MENITKEEFIDTVKKTVDLSARGTADIGSKEMTGNNGTVSMFVTACHSVRIHGGFLWALL